MFVLTFLLILVVLILVHEFGHFIVAKAFGIRVDEFGVFFPPRLWAKKWKGTEYSLNLLPFGGFVKIFGEEAKEGEDDSRSFVRKPKWVQASVLVAGIVGNLLFAWLVLSMGYMVGMPTSREHIGFGEIRNPETQILAVVPEGPAAKAGILPGDVVTDVQTGTASLFPNSDAEEVQKFIANHQHESIIFHVTRGEERKEFLARPVEGLVEGRKAVGVELGDVGILQLPPHLALVQGALVGWELFRATAEGLFGFLWSAIRGVADFGSVAGPIGIAGIGATAVKSGFAATIILTALISMNLAILNILPIPGLDGGRLLFVIIEGITGRPIPPKVASRFMFVGFALLILLMLVVSYHDVLRLVRPA